MSLSVSSFDRELKRLVGADSHKFKYLLAVSGGVDSITMAELFFRGGYSENIALAHANFSLRGDESDGDEAFVREWAERHKMPFHTRRFDTAAYAESRSISIEMAARELRYDWFRELAASGGFDFIAVAHNRNDNVETLLLHLLRGAGIRGVAGMRALGGGVLRPLLRFEREDIEAFATAEGLLHREDRTNDDTAFVRNHIRHKVIPELRAVNPSFIKTASGEIEHLGEAGDILAQVLAEKEGSLYVREKEHLSISLLQLESEKHPAFWLFELLRDYGFNSTQVSDAILSARGQSGGTFLSEGYELVVASDSLKVYPRGRESCEESLLEPGGSVVFCGRSISCTVGKMSSGFDPSLLPACELYLDAAKVRLPFTVREWRPADRFRPFGMKRGMKKLSDFFTGLHLDRVEKRRQPVLTDADGNVVCVPPWRIDDRFRVEDSTSNILKIKIS